MLPPCSARLQHRRVACARRDLLPASHLALQQRRNRPLDGEEPECKVDERVQLLDLRFKHGNPLFSIVGHHPYRLIAYTLVESRGHDLAAPRSRHSPTHVQWALDVPLLGSAAGRGAGRRKARRGLAGERGL